MNKKERQRRLWKANFKRQHQRKIWEAVERVLGVPPEFCCVYIAKIAERLSEGRLKTVNGVLLVSDQGVEEPPLATAHCWNMLGDEPLDLTPWGETPHSKRYVTPSDGDEYWFYSQQTTLFPEGDLTDSELELFMLAMNADVEIFGLGDLTEMDLENTGHFSSENSSSITT